MAMLAIGLQRRGVSVRIVVFYAGDTLEQEVRGAGVPIEVLDKKGRRSHRR